MCRLENLKRNPLKLITLLVLGAACSESASPRDDAGPAADARTDAGVAADALPADTGEPPDAGTFTWPLPTGPVAITPHESWKNRVTLDDDFMSRPLYDDLNPIGWIKFVVLMRDPTKVYFQNSITYPFHYEFATERLDPFDGLDRAQFDALSLHESGQEAILGAILISPKAADVPEFGVQLVRAEPYHPEMVRIVFELVKSSVDGAARSFYFPTFEQTESARAFEGYFAEHGIELGSSDRWLQNDGCYSPGWAFGKLVYVPGTEIDAAYTAGTLTSADILVTDGVPAEVPYVAGIISLTPSTPSSHVAILSQSYLIPFAFPASADGRAEIMALAGHEVVYRANPYYYGCEVKVLDVGGELDQPQKTELLSMKVLPPVHITPKASFGALSASTENISPADVRFFGGKAAHFGLLRDAIPASSPAAIAFSFDLFDAFMGQTVSSGKTLRQDIADRIAPHQAQLDIRALKQSLAEVRDTITGAAAFDSGLEAGIESALAPFDPLKNIRFRSSSNAEDGVTFTGAGLYDSYSGCLADDLDQDEDGPSLCDPSEPKERGVFRAIKKVIAGFYNDNAVLERVRHRLPEDQVGMAILVHHSFPDEIELANGVAVLRRSEIGSYDIQLVTQLGAESITNPAGNARPEIVSIYKNGLGTYPTKTQGSSLVPLGAYVLAWDEDYVSLAGMFASVAERYAALNPSRTTFLLDFEYKKVAPGMLVVKQVRPLPNPDYTPSVATYLVDEPTRWCVSQGESGDAFSNHRLKSIWETKNRNLRLTPENLGARSIFSDVQVDYRGATGIAHLGGDPAGFAGAIHRVDMDRPFDAFTIPNDAFARTWELGAWLPVLVAPSQVPVVTVRDGYMFVDVTYASGVPHLDFNNLPALRMNDGVMLGTLCPDTTVLTSVNMAREETLTNGTVSIHTRYYFPEYPRGISAGYTAPLYKWDQTEITGLTTQPIILRGYWSQTYRPAHHNFGADYIFEPALEENIPAGILSELEAADIQYIYATTYGQDPLWAVGLDGQLRVLR